MLATRELENRDREGYARQPQRLDKLLRWEAEAVGVEMVALT